VNFSASPKLVRHLPSSCTAWAAWSRKRQLSCIQYNKTIFFLFQASFNLFIKTLIKTYKTLHTFKALHTGHPPYLTDHLQYHKSSVSTRSSTSQLLAIPRHNLSFGSRSFRVSAQKICNSLTPQICHCQTLATFRRHLKTHYFQSAFSAT